MRDLPCERASACVSSPWSFAGLRAGGEEITVADAVVAGMAVRDLALHGPLSLWEFDSTTSF